MQWRTIRVNNEDFFPMMGYIKMSGRDNERLFFAYNNKEKVRIPAL
jgi:hypothetical protein